MSPRKVEWSSKATKELRKLGPEIGRRIAAAVRRFAKTGEGDVKQMQGYAEHRLRVGDYRVRFTADATTVTVLRIGHRREVYR